MSNMSLAYSNKYLSKAEREPSDQEILDLEKLGRELQFYEPRRKRALARRRDAELGVFVVFPTQGAGP